MLNYFEKKKEKQERKEKGEVAKKVVKGSVVAAALGAAAGVLLAPKSGKETREEISKKTDEVVTSAKELTEKVTSEVKELFEDEGGVVYDGRDGIYFDPNSPNIVTPEPKKEEEQKWEIVR